jgi:hypothetical protein
MSELLKRLTRLTRAHLSDLLAQHWPGWHTVPPPEPDFEPQHETGTSSGSAVPPFEAHAGSGLPYSAELADAYRALDLPFGAPLAQVAKRWKTYLKKCHPDRHANDAEKQADATRLTQELTRAYEKIKEAWARHKV